MADNTPSRLGQVNGSGATDALFLKVFPGEVLAAFEIATKMLPLTMTRTIASGKSAQFPAFGRAGFEYHVPGAEITGDPINGGEIVVTIDGLAISHVSIANIDEAMAQYDLRGPYASELGRTLGVNMDKNVARAGLAGAAASATVSDLPGGTVATYDDEATNAVDLLVGKVFSAAATFDTNSVPETDRYVTVLPVDYFDFVNAAKLTNRDFATNNGGIDSGVVLRIAGIQIVKNINLPTADDTSNTAIPAQYRADYSKTKALVWHKTAIGTVKLIDLQMEKEYSVRRQSTLMVAKYSCGHKYLRPEALYAIKGD